jgi:hypothetical protein
MQTTVAGRRCVCVPDDDARRRRLLCLACHGDAVLRRSFGSSFGLRQIGRARVRRGASMSTAEDRVSVCCCRAWPGDCAPWRYDRSLGFVGRQSSCCCSCRCEVDKARSSVASCCSGAARCRRSRARARRRRRSLPVAGKSVRAPGRLECVARSKRRNERQCTVELRGSIRAPSWSRTSVPAMAAELRVVVGGTTSAGGAWCAPAVA